MYDEPTGDIPASLRHFYHPPLVIVTREIPNCPMVSLYAKHPSFPLPDRGMMVFTCNLSFDLFRLHVFTCTLLRQLRYEARNPVEIPDRAYLEANHRNLGYVWNSILSLVCCLLLCLAMRRTVNFDYSIRPEIGITRDEIQMLLFNSTPGLRSVPSSPKCTMSPNLTLGKT